MGFGAPKLGSMVRNYGNLGLATGYMVHGPNFRVRLVLIT